MMALAALAQQSRRMAMPVGNRCAERRPNGLRRRGANPCARRPIAGWSIIAIFFGCFGAWAMTAPLNGAVVANAVVKVEGNRKSVQHLDGGIVKELRVKEGDRVAADDRIDRARRHASACRA